MDSQIDEVRGLIMRLEKKVDFILKHLQLDYQEPIDPYILDVIVLLQKGKEIDAIKLVREHTGLGLAEAKKMVDDLKRKL
jgi:ribosomal protein L7/L12